MHEFKPVTISDLELFKQHIQMNPFYNSEYNFTTMVAWQVVMQLEYTIIEDCLCVRGVTIGSDKKEFFYFPLGKKTNIEKALHIIIKDFTDKKKPLILMSLSQPMMDMLEEFGLLDKFQKETRRDFADYVYTREKLTTLAGKKLHGKRNHYNYFINNYDYSMVPITPENEPDCRLKIKSLIIERSLNPEEELNATMMALYYRDELGLKGCCLYAGKELVGIILGECHHGMTVVQIAKSDVSFRGASVALFKLFLSEHFQKCEYVNLMEDMGLEGLRQAKLSYNPDFFIEKSILTWKEE